MAQAQAVIPQISIEDGSILVSFPYRVEDVEKAKGVMGARWDREERCWRYPVSSRVAAGLKQAFGRLSVKTDSIDQFRQLLAEAGKDEERQSVKSATDLPPIPGLKTQAWLHQRAAFWFGHDLPATMYAMEMGTGKSLVIVGEFVNLITEATPAPLGLILCPLSVILVWVGVEGRPGQFAVHAERQDIVVLGLNEGSVADKTARVKQAVATAKARKQPLVLVVNPESARNEPLASVLCSLDLDLLVMDESHRLKAPGGVTSKFVAKVAARAKKRRALTGTPIPHGLEDAYAQYRALDPGIFGTSFARFKSRYCVMGGYGGYQIVGYRNEEEFNKLFYSIGFRVTKDVLDLPGRRHIRRYFKLSSEARRLSEKLDQDLMAEVEGGTVTAANALVRLLRLQQITSGFLPVDLDDDAGSSEIRIVDTGKEDLLGEVLEDLAPGEPVVVFCRYTADLDAVHRVAAKLGRKSLELSGRKHQLEAWQAWQAPVLAVQIQAGGVGISLVRSHVGIYYSVDYNYANYDQSTARQDRPGQTEPVLFIHLVGENSIDLDVLNVLDQRKDGAETLLAEHRRRRSGSLEEGSKHEDGGVRR